MRASRSVFARMEAAAIEEAALVALDDTGLLDRNLAQGARVDQQMLRGDAQGFDGSTHGRDACPVDVDLVDLSGLDEGDRPGVGLALDQLRKLHAQLRPHLFGVVDAGGSPVGLQHHRRRRHWPCERAHPPVTPARGAHPGTAGWAPEYLARGRRPRAQSRCGHDESLRRRPRAPVRLASAGRDAGPAPRPSVRTPGPMRARRVHHPSTLARCAPAPQAAVTVRGKRSASDRAGLARARCCRRRNGRDDRAASRIASSSPGRWKDRHRTGPRLQGRRRCRPR